MNAPSLVVIALLAGGLAGAVGGRFAAPEVVPAVAAATDVSPRLVDLEARVAQLAAAAAVSPAPVVAVARDRDEPLREPATPVDAEARRRLDVLEHTVAKLAAGPARAGAPTERDQATAAADAAAAKKSVAEHQRAIVHGANDAEKLAAWRELRHQADSYDDAVVATMVQVGLSSQDAAVRADVWRQADGRSKHPSLPPALLQALQSDGEARVREEAAETLAGYLESPGVRAALTAAMSADADEKVRRQASRSLEPRGR